jgi:hypothetical protein
MITAIRAAICQQNVANNGKRMLPCAAAALVFSAEQPL